MKTLYRILNLCLFMLLTAGTLFAQAPRTFSYQGLLLDKGEPAKGTHQITVKLYDAPSGGTTLHTENFSENFTSKLSKLEDGFFSVVLGSKQAMEPTITFDKEYWLGMSIDTAEEMTPRTRLTSVPYAGTLGGGEKVAKSIIGTANQVLANGTSGSQQTDDVTLTLPQNIHSGASPTFVNLTLTGKGTSAATVSGDGSTTLTTKGYVDGGDATNAAAISSETSARQAAITAEMNARISGDNTLTSYLNDQFNIAMAGEGALTSNLATEVSRATGAEGVITTNLNNEITRATAAEGNKWALGGNSSPSSNIFGTTSATDVLMYAGNTQQMNLLASGGINIPSTASTGIGVVFQNGTRLIHSYGVNNIFVGAGAGNFTMTGSAINNPGDPDYVVTGEGDNTALGNLALASNITGYGCTAVGAIALTTNTTGVMNTAIGHRALTWNTNGLSQCRS